MELLKFLVASVAAPVIEHGGAGCYSYICDAFDLGLDAVAVGCMVVFQMKGCGVLVHYEGSLHHG